MFFHLSAKEVDVLAVVLMFVKSLLVPLRSKPPTFAQEKAFLDYEDEFGYSTSPSPAEIYQMDVEWVAGMRELPLWSLLVWRLAVAWMPFCKGEQRLVGERLSRKLFQVANIYGLRRKARARKVKVNA